MQLHLVYAQRLPPRVKPQRIDVASGYLFYLYGVTRMPYTRTVALSPPEAKRCADLSGVLADLAEVKRHCERFLRQIASG